MPSIPPFPARLERICARLYLEHVRGSLTLPFLCSSFFATQPEKVLKRLKERGFCTGTGEPTAKGLWTSLDADQIIQLYSSVNRGLQNYYRFVDNWKQCSRIQYILKFSLAKTLAQKYKISVPQVFQRFGKDLSLLMKGRGGKPDRQVSFYQNQDWTKKKQAFQGGSQGNMDVVRTLVRLRTRSKLGKPCCICGEAQKQIEMHHIRHIRKLSNKRVATGSCEP